MRIFALRWLVLPLLLGSAGPAIDRAAALEPTTDSHADPDATSRAQAAAAKAAAEVAVKVTAALTEALKNVPILPPPVLASGPTFSGAVEPIVTLLPLKMRPFGERPAITVTDVRTADAAAPQRKIARAWIRAERVGDDIATTVRFRDATAGKVTATFTVVSDEYGMIKNKHFDLPSSGATNDPATALAGAIVNAVVEALPLGGDSRPAYPRAGIRTGDAVEVEVEDAPTSKADRRQIVRGLATFEGRRVVVADVVGTVTGKLGSETRRGYALIDADLGLEIYSIVSVASVTRTQGGVARTETLIVSRKTDSAAKR